MTKQDAIKVLDPDYRDDYALVEQVDEACRMAISALDKSIPKRPKYRYCSAVNKKGACPRCGMTEDESANYCRCCGQALDWTNTNNDTSGDRDMYEVLGGVVSIGGKSVYFAYHIVKTLQIDDKLIVLLDVPAGRVDVNNL